MQRNDLVADDVVAGCQLSREDRRGLEVVGDECVGYPFARGDDGGLREFSPAEGRGGEGSAVA